MKNLELAILGLGDTTLTNCNILHKSIKIFSYLNSLNLDNCTCSDIICDFLDSLDTDIIAAANLIDLIKTKKRSENEMTFTQIGILNQSISNLDSIFNSFIDNLDSTRTLLSGTDIENFLLSFDSLYHRRDSLISFIHQQDSLNYLDFITLIENSILCVEDKSALELLNHRIYFGIDSTFGEHYQDIYDLSSVCEEDFPFASSIVEEFRIHNEIRDGSPLPESDCSISLRQKKNTNNNRVVIYPNPSSSFLNLETKEKFSRFTIINLSGNIIKEGKLESNQVSIENIPSGLYTLKISNEYYSEYIKFIKID